MHEFNGVARSIKERIRDFPLDSGIELRPEVRKVLRDDGGNALGVTEIHWAPGKRPRSEVDSLDDLLDRCWEAYQDFKCRWRTSPKPSDTARVRVWSAYTGRRLEASSRDPVKLLEQAKAEWRLDCSYDPPQPAVSDKWENKRLRRCRRVHAAISGLAYACHARSGKRVSRRMIAEGTWREIRRWLGTPMKGMTVWKDEAWLPASPDRLARLMAGYTGWTAEQLLARRKAEEAARREAARAWYDRQRKLAEVVPLRRAQDEELAEAA